MSDGKQFWALLIIGFLAFAEFSSWVMASWPGDCLVTPEQDYRVVNQANQKSCPTFFVGSRIILRRADRVIGAYDKSIVAVFTIVLAISTIGLWWSTKALWKAGEHQLEHFVGTAERELRAYVYVEKTQIGPGNLHRTISGVSA